MVCRSDRQCRSERSEPLYGHPARSAEQGRSGGYRVENTNPCYVVRCNRKVMRTRHLSEAELVRLGTALADLRDHEDQSLRSQAVAITLLLLTGCPRGEILSLQWSDLRGNRLKLRDSKTGPRTVWLGQEAVDLLASHPRSPKVPWIL